MTNDSRLIFEAYRESLVTEVTDSDDLYKKMKGYHDAFKEWLKVFKYHIEVPPDIKITFSSLKSLQNRLKPPFPSPFKGKEPETPFIWAAFWITPQGKLWFTTDHATTINQELGTDYSFDSDFKEAFKRGWWRLTLIKAKWDTLNVAPYLTKKHKAAYNIAETLAIANAVPLHTHNGHKTVTLYQPPK